MKKPLNKQYLLKRLANFAYGLIIAALTFMFFTNDFGLVDIRKTSVVVAVGLDYEGDTLTLSAEVALPQPSEAGENTKFTVVTGKGETVGSALKEINAKTGFYPKLVFCNLIILGEGCQKQNIFTVLDYFYRNEYTRLTPLVVSCKGQAGELLSTQFPLESNVASSIERLLSDEAKKSGNVSTVSLKEIGQSNYSHAQSCYMPYLEIISNPEDSGGSQGGGGQSGSQSGGQSGSQGGSQGGGESGGQESKELVCGKTALYTKGNFIGILPQEQAFALNLIKNDIRHTFVPFEADGATYTAGLRECKCKTSVSVKNGTPELEVEFKAFAQLQDKDEPTPPEQASKEKSISKEVLNGVNKELMRLFDALIGTIKQTECDALGLKESLYKSDYSRYAEYAPTLLKDMKVNYKINVRSAGG